MTEKPPAAPTPRMVRAKGARSQVKIVGRPGGGLADVYHHVLTMPSWQFAGAAALLYAALNLAFAGLYVLDHGGLSGARPGVFADAFNFSVETLGTIGYGVISPRSGYANALVAIEAFLSIVVTALATGLIFARVSRPTARVMFARTALITTFDGRPAFIFRAANQRDIQVLEAEVTVSLAFNERTREGLRIRRLKDLTLERHRSPMFALSWTVIHIIDEASPLHDKTAADLTAAEIEFVVVLAGTEPTFASRVHARHSYLPTDVQWGRYYDDVIYPGPDGGWIADYSRFHDTHAAGEPSSP